MRSLLLLVCCFVCCLAQRPQPCTSPSLLTGKFSVTHSRLNLAVYVKFSYDARRERIRLRQFGWHGNHTFHSDYLLLYKEKVMYEINVKNLTCCKIPLNHVFHPLAVPKDANLLSQNVIGSSSRPAQGLLVNTWNGEITMKQNQTVKFLTTFTDSGCIPVNTLYQLSKTSWVFISHFDNVIGIPNPSDLIPPSYCDGTLLKETDPVAFFDLF